MKTYRKQTAASKSWNTGQTYKHIQKHLIYHRAKQHKHIFQNKLGRRIVNTTKLWHYYVDNWEINCLLGKVWEAEIGC